MEKFQDRFFEELKERLNTLGIKAILFDFDDTLIYTSEIFARYMREYVDKVVMETGMSFEAVDTLLRKTNDEEYKKMGVNPSRWGVVVERMTTEVESGGESMVRNLGILMKIYEEEPRIKSGSKAILEILKMAGIKVALVTHANEDWTWRKLESVGMAGYFDLIKIVDENKHKGAGDWLETIDGLDVSPSECLVLGDSLSGDIIPADSIGARTMWLHNGSTWSMYRTGTVPEGTMHLDEVNQLLSALEGLE